MLAVLLLTVLCFTAGTHGIMYDEIRAILDGLQTSEPDEMIFSPERSAASSEEYHVASSSVPSLSEYSSDKWYATEPTREVTLEHEPDETSESSEHQPQEEYIEYPKQVGSIRGIPGVNFPDYTDIPLTSFHCTDKAHIPGFYADMETGCQIFHVCWPHRRESFLCPVGTTFNQAILACDYWYSSNCSLASHYYDINNDESSHTGTDYEGNTNLGSMIDNLLGKGHLEPTETSSEDPSDYTSEKSLAADLSYLLKFLPVKTKVVVYPETAESRSKIVAEASVGKTNKRKVHKQKPVAQELEIRWEPEFVPAHPKHSSVSSRPHEVVAPKNKQKHAHGGLDPSVSRIIDEVFDIAKKIVKEAGGFIPKLENVDSGRSIKPAVDVHEVKKPAVHVRKPIPLTKLNPRFITKPAVVKLMAQKPAEVPKVLQTYVHLKPQTEFKSFHHSVHKPAVSKPFESYKLNVSPLTKNTLNKNYLKLLKIKSN